MSEWTGQEVIDLVIVISQLGIGNWSIDQLPIPKPHIR
jgi:hypothetical protein